MQWNSAWDSEKAHEAAAVCLRRICPGRLIACWQPVNNGLSSQRIWHVVTTQGEWFVKAESGNQVKRYTMLSELIPDRRFQVPLGAEYLPGMDVTLSCAPWIHGIPLGEYLEHGLVPHPERLFGMLGEQIADMHRIACIDQRLAWDHNAAWSSRPDWLSRLAEQSDDAARVLAFVSGHRELMRAVIPCLTHQDLRAGNVLILEDGQPCIIDFSSVAFSSPYSDLCKITLLAPPFVQRYESDFLQGVFGHAPEQEELLRIGLFACVTLACFPAMIWPNMPAHPALLHRACEWLSRHRVLP